MLLAELLVLTLRFDMESATRDGLGGSWFLLQTPTLAQLAVAVAMATFVLAALSPRAAFWGWLEDLGWGRRSVPFLLAHLGAFILFFWLSAEVIEGSVRRHDHGGVWVLLWFLAGLATFLSWIAALVNPRHWFAIARPAWKVALAGIVIGLAGLCAGKTMNAGWEALAVPTLRVSYGLLILFGQDTVYQPAEFILGTRTFQVEIAPMCSGYEGIGLILVFLSVYLWSFRRELCFPKALILLPLGALLAWFANAMRIALLVLVGTWISPEIALGGFHSQAGWLMFNVVALGMVAATRHSGLCQRHEVETTTADDAQRDPTTAYLAPFLTIVAVQMLTTAFSTGSDTAYPLRIVAAAVVLVGLRHTYGELRWSWHWTALAWGLAVFTLWVPLVSWQPSSSPIMPQLIQDMSPALAGVWLTFRLLGSVIVIPLAEELAFRGYLMRRLQGADFTRVPPGQLTWVSFLASSILFGLMHGQWLAGTLAGMAYALAYHQRGKLGDAVLAHAVTNALLAGYALGTGAWHVWC